MLLQIPLFGGLQSLCPIRKDFESRGVVEENVHLGLHYGTPSLRTSFTTQAINTVSVWENSPLSAGEFRYSLSTAPEELVDFAKQSTEGSDALVAPAVQPEAILSSTDTTSGKFESVSNLVEGGNESLAAATKASATEVFAGINETFSDSINKGENALRSSVDSATSFIDSVVKNATTSADNAFSKVFSAADQTGELANKKITSFSSEIDGVTSKAPGLVIDVLRRTVVAVESSLSSGASYVVYLYGSAKEFLPAEIRDTVNIYEDKAAQVLRPVGSATQQVTYS